jgi:hypothetical protein
MSSASEDTKGMIITPMTRPAASALSEATSSPERRADAAQRGATVSAAKKP